MHRFVNKKKAILLGCTLAVIALVTLAVNLSLSFSESVLIRQVDRNLTHRISLGGAGYFFPNTLIIKDILIEPKPGSGLPEHTFHIPLLKGKVDLIRSLLNWELRISSIHISDSRLSWAYFCEFLRRNHAEIIRLIKSLPEGNIRIETQATRFLLAQRSAGPDYIETDIHFILKDDWIRLFGSLDPEGHARTKAKRGKIRNQPRHFLRFDLNGDYVPNGFILNSLTLNGSRLYTKLWGDLDDSVLSLKGFSFLDTQSKGRVRRKKVNMLQRVGFLFRVLKGGTPAPEEDLSQINFYVTDIDTQIKLDFPSLHFRYLTMLFNNAPLHAGGRINLENPVNFDLAFSFYPAASHDLDLNNFKRIDLKLNGLIENDTYRGDSEMVILLTERKKGLQWIQTGLTGLQFDFNSYPRLQAAMDRGYTSCWVSGNEHRVTWSEAALPINLEGENKTIGIHTDLYGGTMDGEMQIDASAVPFKITSHLETRDVDANQLQELLIHFGKVHGRLDSRMDYQNRPQQRLKGELSVNGGNLTDYEFFKWLSENFGLHSLLSVDFDKARAGFLINDQKAGVFDIDLVSDSLNIQGDFFVRPNDLVESKLALAFHRRLIQESPKLAPIIKFFDPETRFVDFDFQLSGNLHAMNFYWLENPAKQRIRDGLPNFIERIIDHRVNAELK